MEKYLIRFWKETEVEDLAKHLLIVGELTGDCANCREINIDYTREKYCPKCKTEFKYITSRPAALAKSSRFSIMKRIKDRRPDLILIDHQDYKEIMGKIKAKKLL